MDEKLKFRCKSGFYIGDPEYAMNSEVSKQWQKEEYRDGVFRTSSGYKFGIFGTYEGDGIYKDSLGNEYTVDTGCISIIPMYLVDRVKLNSNLISLGKIITDKDVELLIKDGVFYFSTESKEFTIDTIQ